MFSLSQQLCTLEHVQSKDNLKLTSNSSLKLSVPQDLPFLVTPPSERLHALISARTWVVRGRGLKVSFVLDTEQLSFTTSDRSDLAEVLGVFLRDAEVVNFMSNLLHLLSSHRSGTNLVSRQPLPCPPNPLPTQSPQISFST